MSLRKPSSRWALWLFAVALLVKSAMPLLASASAQLQGKALVEVCTVYGISLVPSGGDDREPAPDHGSTHANEHCALAALTALATNHAAPVGAQLPLQHDHSPLPPASRSPRPADACADWIARLKHGPPSVT